MQEAVLQEAAIQEARYLRSNHPRSRHLKSRHLKSSYPRSSHLRNSYARSSHSAMLKASKYLKKLQFKVLFKVLLFNLSRKELELKAKNRGIEGYKSMSKDKLLSIFDKSELVKKTKAIRVIRKINLIQIKIQETFLSQKITKILKKEHQETLKNLVRLEKDKNIKDSVLRDIKNLFESDKAAYQYGKLLQKRLE